MKDDEPKWRLDDEDDGDGTSESLGTKTTEERAMAAMDDRVEERRLCLLKCAVGEGRETYGWSCEEREERKRVGGTTEIIIIIIIRDLNG